MNKEEFCKYVPIAYHDIYIGDCMRVENVIQALNEHFVCIPKGVNRHPYVDVIHAYAEGAEIQYKGINDMWSSPCTDFPKGLTYRIKPSEPVYEWQWVYKHRNIDFFQTLVTNGVNPKAYFKSEEEARLYTNAERVWKMEETKRVRKGL